MASKVFRLSNGLTVVFRPMRLAPVVALQMWVDAGAASDPEEFPGMAHLFEHLLFKGNPSRRMSDLVATVEAVGGSFEAWTSHDHTVYEVLLPSRHVRLGLDVLADALGPFSVDEETLRREFSIIDQEDVRRADDPWTDTADMLVALAFEGHPYARSVTGDPRRLARAAPADVEAFHRRHYRAGRMTLVVVGDVDEEALDDLLDDTVGDLPRGGDGARPPPADFAPQARVRTAVEFRSAGLAYIGLGFRTPGARDPATAHLALLAAALGDGPASRLPVAMVRGAELAVHVEVTSYPERDGSVLAAIASTQPEKWDRALEAILAVLAETARAPLPLSELERTRRLIALNALYGVETVEDVADRIGFDAVATGDADYEVRFQAAVASIGPREIQEAARTWLRPDRLSVVVVLPDEDGDADGETVDRVRERIREIVRATLGAPERAAPPAGPLDVRLSCGARLVVRPEPGAPLVAVDAFFPGGQLLESERTAGLQGTIARLLLRGTATRAAEEIDRAIDEMAAGIHGVADLDALGVSAAFPAAEALRGLGLVADCLRAPSFPADEFERDRRRAIADLRAAETDAFDLAYRQLLPRLLPGHPYRLDPHGTPATLGRITRSAVARAWEDGYPLDRLTVVVSGDISPEAVRSTLEARLGPGGRRRASAVRAPQPVEAEVRERDRQVVVRGDFARAHVLAGFRAPGGDDERRYAASIVAEALAGDSGLLMAEVRESRGLAYDVGADYRAPIGQGFLTVHAACDERNVEAVLRVLDDIFARLAAHGLPPEAVAHAQDLLVGSYALDMQRVSDRNRLAARGIYVRGELPTPERYEARVRAVTPADVRALAASIFDPARRVTAIALPPDGGRK